MHESELKRMRDLIRTRRYVMTLHAEDEMDADQLTIYDVEHIVLTGSVIERQKDQTPAEWKFVVNGRTLADAGASVVVKFGPTGKRVFITVFRE